VTEQYAESLHYRALVALNAHRPARRHHGLLVAVDSSERQTTCLCGRWRRGSYDDHVRAAIEEVLAG